MTSLHKSPPRASAHVAPATASTGELLLDVAGLSVTFTGRDRTTHRAVDGLDLQLRRGRVLALVGESGSGKSVTARSLIGLAGEDADVRAERLDILGEDARNHSERQWRQVRGRRIGFVLQDALTSLDPLRTIEAEIAEALSAPRAERRTRVEQLMTEVGIPDPGYRRTQYPHQLSGGQRQRALIASALAGAPDILVADEPTTALDVTVQARILRLLRQLADTGHGVLLISHDLAVVSQVADDVIVLHEGVAVESGPVDQVIGDPQHAYTRRLLAAVPGRHTRGHRLVVGDGESRERLVRAAPSDTVAVEVEGLTKTYRVAGGREFVAARDVSFSIRHGETVGLVGESGSGKSTVARIVAGLLDPDVGRVRIGERTWSQRRSVLLRRTQESPRLGSVQLVAQDSVGSFDPRYTVAEIVGETVALRRSSRSDRRRRVDELLALVHLPARVRDLHPRVLSGGQRQRVSIARALASEPDLLVCDEPVSALDVSIQAQILDLIEEVQATSGTSLLFISHDIGVVRHVADHVLVMHQGSVVEQGAAESVLADPSDPYTKELLAAVPTL